MLFKFGRRFVMKKQNIPNIITGFRLIFTPVLLWCIVAEDFAAAFVLACLMSLSDAVDGWLAKGCGWETRFGRFFDPLADKVMVVSSFIVLGVSGLLPLWLVVIVAASSIALVAGGAVFYFRFRDLYMKPPKISKINTLLQLLLIILILFARSGFSAEPSIVLSAADWLVYVVFVTTMLSFLVYLFTWQKCRAHLKSR